MNLDDEIDLRLLDAASKVSMGAIDRSRQAVRWYRRHREQVKVWRLENPSTFDQVAVVALAGVLECVAAILKRRR